MSKKIFIGLLLISLLMFSGGCNSSSHNNPVNDSTDVNSAMKGAWTSESGTAELTVANSSIDTLNADFGEIPAEVLDQMKIESPDEYALYEAYMNQEESTTKNVNITKVMALFDECDVSETNGTAKLTLFLILNDGELSLPHLFSNLNLTTHRNGTNTWTAEIPDVGNLSITMSSEEKINLSGTVKYLDYECEFNSVIDKNNTDTSIKPNEILDGTWTLGGNNGGGYLAYDSYQIASVIPEDVSVNFSGTTENLETSMATSVSLNLKSALSVSDEDSSKTRIVYNTNSLKLTKVFGDLYKLSGEDGDAGYVIVNNTDDISLFIESAPEDEVQACIFLPLKKAESFDFESALSKTWRAVEGDGGGYITIESIDNPDDDPFIEDIKEALKQISFTVKNCEITFSDVSVNDDNTVDADMSMNAVFNCSYNIPALSDEELPFEDLGGLINFVKVGNILYSADEDETGEGVMYFSFISENEALFSMEVNMEGEGTFKSSITLRADE